MESSVKNLLGKFLSSNQFNGSYLIDEPMSLHTSYKIGGSVDYFIECNDHISLKNLVRICNDNNIFWIIVGGGSNLLVSDWGIDGVVIRLSGEFKQLEFDEDTSSYIAGGACKLSKVVNDAYKHGFSGMEFGVGTPGSVGGAIKMNAGTATCGISNCLEYVDILDANSLITRVNAKDIKWGYRKSSIMDDEIILSACINVKKINEENDVANMRKTMDKKLRNRKVTQPQQVATCGSVFKNPEDDNAGRLIEEAGLKGKKVGGARVSSTHANFIENCYKASAQDIVELIQEIQKTVYEKFNTKLQPEVKFVGFYKSIDIFE